MEYIKKDFMMLYPEFVDFLKNELKALEDELISITELPDVDRLRSRIKKDKRDTVNMLRLYKDITNTNERIKETKVSIRYCIAKIKEQVGQGVKKTERQVICIVCQDEKLESEMDDVNICDHCKGKED